MIEKKSFRRCSFVPFRTNMTARKCRRSLECFPRFLRKDATFFSISTTAMPGERLNMQGLISEISIFVASQNQASMAVQYGCFNITCRSIQEDVHTRPFGLVFSCLNKGSQFNNKRYRTKTARVFS